MLEGLPDETYNLALIDYPPAIGMLTVTALAVAVVEGAEADSFAWEFGHRAAPAVPRPVSVYRLQPLRRPRWVLPGP